MITLAQAVQKAEQETGWTVSSVKDCGDRWSMNFKEEAGTISTLPMFIMKETGDLEYFFMTAENIELLKRGILVKLTREPADD